MNGRTIWMWILALLMLAYSSFAADGCKITENCTWWAYDSGSTYANISIMAPNGSEIAQGAMDSQGSGYYTYGLKINQTGNYLGVVAFYNASGLRSHGSESKEVEDISMLQLAVVIAIISLIVFVLYGAHRLTKAQSGEWSEILNLLGVVCYFWIGLLFTILTFVIMEMAKAASYYPVIRALFIVVMVIFGLIGALGTIIVGLMAIYLLFASIIERVYGGGNKG